jgi:hypothetical protein
MLIYINEKKINLLIAILLVGLMVSACKSVVADDNLSLASVCETLFSPTFCLLTNAIKIRHKYLLI